MTMQTTAVYHWPTRQQTTACRSLRCYYPPSQYGSIALLPVLSYFRLQNFPGNGTFDQLKEEEEEHEGGRRRESVNGEKGSLFQNQAKPSTSLLKTYKRWT